MPKIHPTATVGPDVQLSDGVVVGAYCVLQGRIMLGEETRLMHHVTLQGPLTLGRNNRIYSGACLGFAPQDRKYDHDQDGAGLVIGDDNVFRECFTAHRATKDRPTTIGSRGYFMVNAHVGHDARVGNDVTMANNAPLGGHVEVNDSAIIGGNSAIHQFVRIGRLAMVGGGLVLGQDVPPFCVSYASKLIGALNIIGLRRAGLGKHTGPLRKAFDLIFRSRLSRPTAVQRILDEFGDDPLCVEMAQFVRDSKRGITRYGGTRGDIEEAVL